MSKAKVMRAAAELADAAGRVINNTGLSDLESAIATLNLKLVKYDQELAKAKCDFCPIPCFQPHCCTKDENEQDGES